MTEKRAWQPSQRLVFLTTTALSVAGIILDHHSAILGALEPYYVATLPFLQMLLGIVAGYSLCRWRLNKDVEDMGKRVDAAESGVESLAEDLAGRPTRQEVDKLSSGLNDALSELRRRPTHEEVEEAFARYINEFVDDVARMREEMSKTPDARLRERIDSGEVSGFDARALGEVLALDVEPRRWLRSARDEGYVDVEDRVIGDYDRLGHFRNLVTAAETGLTSEWGKPMARYVLNPGVRDVLEAFPEVFELVDEEDKRLRELLTPLKGKPYDPDTARYKRVSR